MAFSSLFFLWLHSFISFLTTSSSRDRRKKIFLCNSFEKKQMMIYERSRENKVHFYMCVLAGIFFWFTIDSVNRSGKKKIETDGTCVYIKEKVGEIFFFLYKCVHIGIVCSVSSQVKVPFFFSFNTFE